MLATASPGTVPVTAPLPLLVLNAVVKNMPFASRAGTSNMLQIRYGVRGKPPRWKIAGFLRQVL